MLLRSALCAALLAPINVLPASADEISDAIQRAMDAYAAGDIALTSEELTYASQQLQSLKSDALAAYLPAAPDGWTREINSDMAAGLAIMGGGTGVEASYSGPEASFTITLMADNPMVASMGAMLASGMAGKMIRVGSVKFTDQDGSLATMVANRVLVQAQGAPSEVMIPVLETMDFGALGSYGS